MGSNQRQPMGPPETPNRYVQQSPGLFPTLQLSPDMFGNQMSAGPATAPIYPNQRLFWDPSTTTFQDPTFGQPFQDPFQYSPVMPNTPFASSSTIMPSYTAQQPVPQEQPYDLPALPRAVSYTHMDTSAFPAPFTTSPRVPAPQMENPSMFLSSPARRFGTADHLSNGFAQPRAPERPAYAHQMEESKREEEMKRLRRTEVRKPSITRSVMEALRRPVSPMKDSRPGLKRSLTHTGARSDRGLKVSTLGGRNSPAPAEQTRNRGGRSSPLKTTIDPISRTVSTSRRSKRSSLSLSIDENGVAKTIMTKVPDMMDVDEDSDSQSESSEDDAYKYIHSQSNSFAYGGDDDLAQSRNQRQYGHSKNSSRSTMASYGSGRQSSYQSSQSSAPNTRGSDHQQGRKKRPVLGNSLHGDTLMEEEPSGNAQSALRAIIQDRSRSTSSQGDSNQLHSSPPLQQGQYAMYNNVSPTTITDPDLATPSTDRDSVPGGMTVRCLCKSSSPGVSVPMIQW
jgi:hypothetical protein